MNDIIKKIIEANIDYIENKEFFIVYERALAINHKINIGELTDIFYTSGIDPLASMTEVPPLFLDRSELLAITIPENINKIRKSGFAFSNIETIQLHNKCELTESCFFGSNIHSIIIPYIMNEIPEECFSGCLNLTDVDLNAVEQIGEESFFNCHKLTQIYIPDDINFIADSAFINCPALFLIHPNNEYVIDYCQRNKRMFKFV